MVNLVKEYKKEKIKIYQDRQDYAGGCSEWYTISFHRDIYYECTYPAQSDWLLEASKLMYENAMLRDKIDMLEGVH